MNIENLVKLDTCPNLVGLLDFTGAVLPKFFYCWQLLHKHIRNSGLMIMIMIKTSQESSSYAMSMVEISQIKKFFVKPFQLNSNYMTTGYFKLWCTDVPRLRQYITCLSVFVFAHSVFSFAIFGIQAERMKVGCVSIIILDPPHLKLISNVWEWLSEILM